MLNATTRKWVLAAAVSLMAALAGLLLMIP